MTSSDQAKPARRSLASLLRDAFAIVGFFACIFLLLDSTALTSPMPPAHGEVQGHEVALDAKGTAADLSPVAVRPADARHRALARYVARTYRIATEAADDVVLAASESAKKLGLDPLLVLAVIAIESRFNPIAESEMGAKGLMQVIPKFHLDKLALHGGEPAILDPWINVLVGAQILKEYVTRAGSLEAGLQWYNGAANDESRAYAEKVLTEKDRIIQALGQRPAPRQPAAAVPAQATQPPAAIQEPGSARASQAEI